MYICIDMCISSADQRGAEIPRIKRRAQERCPADGRQAGWPCHTADPPTANLDFRGFDTSRFSILRGGIPGSIRGISQKFGVNDA